ncbi:hypothetical protein F0L74_02850 [Chitinophaga agrisoli]|uniref:Fimbrillin-A associated anchor protein Mfa1/Mfa2 n=1 Tax=Chitinophaga agrisoli TaxID=2607653 RepID=A0A5B2W1Y9_9BACT|nr:hypothetical protein [Chitinophaga agrisoli]KAA2244918.1 hypothetical protein F0L74_02850 [Chitinophaga agrisoli]
MKFNYLILASALCIGVSCQKSNKDVSPEAADAGFKNVMLTFSGDITTSQSPLGRKTDNNSVAARTFADSTVYAITVKKNDVAVYYGFYNRPDSVMLKIPNSGNIIVEALAIRKATGPGFYCYNAYDDKIVYPWLGNIAENRMDTLTGSLYYNIDSLYRYNMFTEDGTSVSDLTTTNSEADSYVGRISFASAQTPAQITLSMRRVSFGIRYNTSNFNSGRLLVDFADVMPAKAFPTTYDLSKQFIYTANELQWRDSTKPVNLTVKWEKPDGSIVVVGQKNVTFYRNVLTNVNITVPNQSTGVPQMPLDTNWQRTANIDF